MTSKIQWEPIDGEKQIWSAKYKVPSFLSRMVAFLSKNNKPLLVGPGARLIGTLPPELAQAGDPQLALLPNSYHWMGFDAWKVKYPHMKAVAAAGAIPRLKKKGCQHVHSLDLFKKVLPDNISLLVPEGLRWGEVWLRCQHPEGITWIVCDSFFNYSRLSNKLRARTLQKLFKAAPGLKISALVKYFLMKDRKIYKHWLFEQLAKDQPTTLVPAHGEILRDPDLPQKIKELVQQRI